MYHVQFENNQELNDLEIIYTPYENIDLEYEQMFFKVFDGIDLSDGADLEDGFQQFELTLLINSVNDAPVILSSPSLIATEDILYSYEIIAEDIDNDFDDLIFEISNNPEGMILLQNNETGNYEINWTPENNVTSSGDIILTVLEVNTEKYCPIQKKYCQSLRGQYAFC